MTTWLLSIPLYVAAVVFLAGMGWRIFSWLRTPVPLKIVLTPASATASGVLRRLVEELLGFRALAGADVSLWIPAWLFHVSLFMLFLGHFGGLVIPQFAQASLKLNESQFEHLARITGSAVGILAVATLLWLLVRRLVLERVHRISTFSDYFALILLLLIISSGNYMRFMRGLDIVQARRFVAGWLMLHPAAPPADPIFFIHILLVCLLLVYIPLSKLVHLGGAALWSPTLNQRNNPRRHRHINPWDNTNESSTA